MGRTNRSAQPTAALDHQYEVSASQAAIEVFTGYGNLYGFNVDNNSISADVIIQFYDKATSPTVGSDPILAEFRIPAAANFGISPDSTAILKFAFGCFYAVVATRGAADAPETNASVNTWKVSKDRS